jgi:hypothetical protein
MIAYAQCVSSTFNADGHNGRPCIGHAMCAYNKWVIRKICAPLAHFL